MKGRLLAAAAAVGGSAVVAELLLRARPPGDRPFSDPLRASVEIEAPIEEVWRMLSDIPGQARWMPEMKEVTVLTPGPVGEGAVGEAIVRIFGIAVTDRVVVTRFEPPVAFGIEHEGLFGGEGLLTLRPGIGGDTTIVDWVERLVPPWMPAVGWIVGRPIMAVMYQRDLYLLRDLVEGGPEADVSVAGVDA